MQFVDTWAAVVTTSIGAIVQATDTFQAGEMG